MKKLKPIELNHGDTIPFKSMHERWGRAEFLICPVLKGKKLVKIFIHRVQQEIGELYFVDCRRGHGKEGMSITSYTHKGIEDPRAWLWNYCVDHKSFSFRVYVPTNATKIDIHKCGTIGFTFDV